MFSKCLYFNLYSNCDVQGELKNRPVLADDRTKIIKVYQTSHVTKTLQD